MTRLLIVEDRYFVAEAMRGALADGGFEVVGVTGLANQALALAARERPHLALMDVLLGDEADLHPEGLELAARLRRDYGVPSLFVTGAQDLLDGEEGIGCVSKPCNHLQLIEAVAASLAVIAGHGPPPRLPEGVRLWSGERRGTAAPAAR
jgi:CheY-like chemotaxis protein